MYEVSIHVVDAWRGNATGYMVVRGMYTYFFFIFLLTTIISRFEQILSYSKLVKRGYIHSLLFKYSKRVCLIHKIDEKYGEKNDGRIWLNTAPVSCDINNNTGINGIVKPCSVKITTITSIFNNVCINKPPLPTNVFDDVNTAISCINTMDIDDIGISSSYRLKYIAKCSTIPCGCIPLCILGDENLNNIYSNTCQETPAYLASWFNGFPCNRSDKAHGRIRDICVGSHDNFMRS